MYIKVLNKFTSINHINEHIHTIKHLLCVKYIAHNWLISH